MMKRLAISIVAIIGLIGTPASAADLNKPVYKAPPSPPIPVFSWTGWYVGINAGGHWGTDKITTTTDTGGGFGPAGAAAIDGASPVSLRPEGFIGGVQAGYNWQVNSFLYGLEADADWVTGTASRTLTGIPVISTGDFMTNSARAEFLGTVRPRLGVVFNQALVYATGGLAVGTVKTSGSFGHFGGTEIETASDTTTQAGWTVGGGLEYAFAPNWSAKIEYLYVDLGSFDLTLPSSPDGAPDSTTVHNRYTDNIVRAGLNFQFH